MRPPPPPPTPPPPPPKKKWHQRSESLDIFLEDGAVMTYIMHVYLPRLVSRNQWVFSMTSCLDWHRHITAGPLKAARRKNKTATDTPTDRTNSCCFYQRKGREMRTLEERKKERTIRKKRWEKKVSSAPHCFFLGGGLACDHGNSFLCL